MKKKSCDKINKYTLIYYYVTLEMAYNKIIIIMMEQ